MRTSVTTFTCIAVWSAEQKASLAKGELANHSPWRWLRQAGDPLIPAEGEIAPVSSTGTALKLECHFHSGHVGGTTGPASATTFTTIHPIAGNEAAAKAWLASDAGKRIVDNASSYSIVAQYVEID